MAEGTGFPENIQASSIEKPPTGEQRVARIKEAVNQAGGDGRILRDILLDPDDRVFFRRENGWIVPKNEGETDREWSDRLDRMTDDFLNDKEREELERQKNAYRYIPLIHHTPNINPPEK